MAIVFSPTLADNLSRAQGKGVVCEGNLLNCRAVHVLWLEENHGVVVLNACKQQTLGLDRAGAAMQPTYASV